MSVEELAYINHPITLPDWGPRLEAATGLSPLESYPTFAAPGQDAERLFWFRWITGHQLTFGLWQALRHQLVDVVEGAEFGHAPTVDEVDRCTALLRSVGGMFLYTASCNRDVYSTTIRNFMRLWHPGFSGTWAADYEGLPNLLGRACDLKSTDAALSESLGRLRRASADCHSVHLAAAKKLVPEGGSLLRDLRSDPGSLPEATSVRQVYDSFFLVRRAPVTMDEFEFSITLRGKRILQDLEVNGLEPSGAVPAGEFPASLSTERFRVYLDQQEELLREGLLALSAVVAAPIRFPGDVVEVGGSVASGERRS